MRARPVPAYKRRQEYCRQMAALDATQAAVQATAADAARAAAAAEAALQLLSRVERLAQRRDAGEPLTTAQRSS